MPSYGGLAGGLIRGPLVDEGVVALLAVKRDLLRFVAINVRGGSVLLLAGAPAGEGYQS